MQGKGILHRAATISHKVHVPYAPPCIATVTLLTPTATFHNFQRHFTCYFNYNNDWKVANEKERLEDQIASKTTLILRTKLKYLTCVKEEKAHVPPSVN
jgi:hypothetical protein